MLRSYLIQWLCSITIINALPSHGSTALGNAISGPESGALQDPFVVGCRKADPETGHKVSEESCEATLALIKSDPKYETQQHWGPRFEGYSWNAPDDPCHIALNATENKNEGDGSLETVVARVRSIFKICADPGWGGRIVLDDKGTGLFVDLFGVNLRPATAVSASNQTSKPAGLSLPPSRRHT